jgi:hypothetical protein
MPANISGLQHRQTLLRIFMFSFVTVIVWIGFNLFQSQSKTEISPELLKLAEPLNPNIDLEAVGRIKLKKTYTDEDLQNFTIYRAVTTREGEKIVTTREEVKAILIEQAQSEQAQSSPSTPAPSPTIPTQPSALSQISNGSGSAQPTTPTPSPSAPTEPSP